VHVTKYARQNDGLTKLTNKGLCTMNRDTYQATRRSIRDNGLTYTAQHALNVDDTDTFITCCEMGNLLRETDWLEMRVSMQRSETKAIAFKLTTTIL
jgi:hypothetical protein